jgi:purine-binding chemotaxis protein CheW
VHAMNPVVTERAKMYETPIPAAALAVSGGLRERAGKYLIFHLGTEEFGMEVEKVQEIVGLQEITAVPHVPQHIKGVINLRGKVISVVDLRRKLGMATQDYTSRTCIIVVRTYQADGDLTIGMIVDGVDEVLNLTGSDIEDSPDFGAGVVTPSFTGIAKVKDKVKILLDIDHVLSGTEMNGLQASLQ